MASMEVRTLTLKITCTYLYLEPIGDYNMFVLSVTLNSQLQP
jgi:hypothetical protein